MKSIVIAFGFLLALAHTGQAAGRYALIIANQNYKTLGALRTTLAEGRAASNTLEALGFAGNITLVTDATTATMTESVDAFAAKTTAAAGFGTD